MDLVEHDLQLIRYGVCGFPIDHRFVHLPPVQMGADRKAKLVDIGVYLLVFRRTLAEATIHVLNVTIQRCEHRVNELSHVSYLQVVVRAGECHFTTEGDWIKKVFNRY